jgi:hypothetical protein
MWVSERDAAAIYAKAATSWYGTRARSVAFSTIQKLNRKGDLRGVEVWRLVHQELLVLEQSRVPIDPPPTPSIWSNAPHAQS